MTTYSKRRGRRSFAAILAAMLMASVLAVVAGSPAGAANTASEVLVDHDNNAKTAKVRQFAGATRYETALALAKDFAEKNGGIGGVPVAFVASGESLIDAVAVSALAGDLNAPVLLTTADELPAATRDWISDNDIEHVVIVGSTADVSEDIAKMLTADGIDTVERIGGDTAGELSVNVAKTITGDCATDLTPVAMDQAALVNGWGRDISPDAITASPVLSYSNLVPILLVGDTLPASVDDYLAGTPAELEGQKVHYNLLAIGGNAAVSPEVMAKAIAAAAAGDAFSVQITNTQHDAKHKDYGKAPMHGDRYFTLRFSDGIARVGDDAAAQDANILARTARSRQAGRFSSRALRSRSALAEINAPLCPPQ